MYALLAQVGKDATCDTTQRGAAIAAPRCVH